MTHERYNMLLH